MEDEFDILAAKVLACEASAEEAARLEEILAQNSQLRAEFTEMQATWAALKEVGPLAQAFDAAPSTPPPARVKDWRAALARKFGPDDAAPAVPTEQERDCV